MCRYAGPPQTNPAKSRQPHLPPTVIPAAATDIPAAATDIPAGPPPSFPPAPTVIPAQAGIQNPGYSRSGDGSGVWIPGKAGMTVWGRQ